MGELDGRIVALDILPMEPIEGVTFIQGDFREDEVLAKLDEASRPPVDVVVSDMAPNLSGVDGRRCGADRRTWSNWRSISRCST